MRDSQLWNNVQTHPVPAMHCMLHGPYPICPASEGAIVNRPRRGMKGAT